MKGTFGDRIDSLKDEIGPGKITGTAEVNQIYAHYQEVGLDFRHPRGGHALYLETALKDNTDLRMEELGRSVLKKDGTDIREGVKGFMEHVSVGVEAGAPVEFINLKFSTSVTVEDHGGIVFHRDADRPRLTEEEIRELKRSKL